jgi:putative ABC transport system permease protein
MRDLGLAVRSLIRSPGFTAVVVLSLGVGIGAATTAYNWVDSFVLHPLPAVPESHRLVSVYTRGPGGAEWSLAYPRFRQWREAAAGSVDLAQFRPEQLSLRTEGTAPERLWADLVSGNFFDVVGVRAIAGRTLTMEDERRAAQVVVLSERYWERRFQRDPALLGRQVTINGNGFTVVGILPAKFGGAVAGLSLEAWLPVTTKPVLDPGNTSLTADGSQWLEGIARPAAGLTFEQTRAVMEAASRRVAASLGDQTPTLAGIRRLTSSGAGRFVGPLFFTLLGLAGVILLIACANIANLLLVRATRRSKEIGVRLALGADRWRIVRQLLTESLLLAAAGGALGLLLAYLGRGLLMAVMPSLPFPVNLTTELNLRVVAMTTVVTAGTALLVGLAPALRASNPALVSAIKDERLPGSGRSLLRNGLVVAQVALSLIALVSAGLFLRSLSEARNADPGFTGADRLLVVDTDFRLAGLPDSAARVQFDRILEGIRTLPGVQAAGTTDDLPVSIGGHSSNTVAPQGYEPGPDENMSIEYGRVSGGYFEAMGIPIIKGRSIGSEDRDGTQPVIVVNEAFVRRFWPDRDPIGAQVQTGGTNRTVVGVAGNVVMERFGEAATPYLYYPVQQRFGTRAAFVIRTPLAPQSLAGPVRAAIQAVNPDLPVLDPRTMTENMAGAMFVQSTGATLLAALGLVALGLAALGLYGVLAFSVSQRTREIGIRMALGSMAGGIVRLVVRDAALLVGIGVMAGGLLAFGVGNLLRSQLFGVRAADPVTFGAVIALLAVVALAAASLPARRAARVDPVVTLKAE